MKENNPNTKTNFLNSMSFKLIILGILILLLLIPVSWIRSLINERQMRRTEAIAEVSSKWGREQTITGPVLSVPYHKEVKKFNADKKGYDYITETRQLLLLPEDLTFDCEMIPEERYRGIYKVIVYKATAKATGSFVKPDLKELEIAESDILWDKVSFSLKISDFRSLQDEINLQYDEEIYSFTQGSMEGLSAGVKAGISLDSKKQEWSFNFNLDFNGSSVLSFQPLGKTTNVTVNSTWQDPSFTGSFLPDSRDISDDGFTANWQILHLNRPIQQVYKNHTLLPINVANEFGVKLYSPVDHYQKSERSIKYAILFIALTFIAFFTLAVSNKVNIHPIQYILIGLALSIFYSLLLSLSEHFGFDLAYWISSASIIILLALYSKAIFKNMGLSVLLSGIILILYGFIFTIIQMQDFALLVGSIGLFIVICILMYISLKLKSLN